MPFFGGGGKSDYVIVGTNIKGGGAGSMPAVIGGNNIGLGLGALANVTDGAQNIAIGNSAGQPDLGLTENNNVIIGYEALDGSPTFSVQISSNVLIGALAAKYFNESDGFPALTKNVLIGVLANLGDEIQGGSDNVIIGYQAGLQQFDDTVDQTDSCVIIGGNNARVIINPGDAGEAVAIGANAACHEHAVVVGRDSFGQKRAVSVGKGAIATAEDSVVVGANLDDGGVLSVLVGDLLARNVRVGAFDFGAAPPVQNVYSSGVAVTTPNNVAENIVETFTIPGGILGPSGFFETKACFSQSGSGNTTYRVKIDGVTVTTFTISATSAFVYVGLRLVNRNDETLNRTANLLFTGVFATESDGANTTFDTTGDLDVTITAQKSIAGDTSTMRQIMACAAYKG